MEDENLAATVDTASEEFVASSESSEFAETTSFGDSESGATPDGEPTVEPQHPVEADCSTDKQEWREHRTQNTARSKSPRRGENDRPNRRPDNVHLKVNPKLLELAEVIAEENGMELQEYLNQALALVIRTHADKLGLNLHRKQLVTEYTKEKTTPTIRVSNSKLQH